MIAGLKMRYDPGRQRTGSGPGFENLNRAAARERDEGLALQARMKENHRVQLAAVAEERDRLMEERDRVLVRLDSTDRTRRDDVQALTKANQAHQAELASLAERHDARWSFT